MTAPLDTRRKRLLYVAQHRGFKEADLVIGGFAEARIATMTEAELGEFEALLQFPDPDLYAWIKGGEPAPNEIRGGPVFEQIRAFDASTPFRGSR